MNARCRPCMSIYRYWHHTSWFIHQFSNCSYTTYRCYQPSICTLSASATRRRMVRTQYTSERSAACASLILGTLAKLWKTTISFVMSVREHGITRLPLDGFSINLIFHYFSKSVEQIKISLKSDNNRGVTLREGLRTFMIISRWIFPKMRNASDKSCRENQNSHFIFCNYFFFRDSWRLRDNVAKYGKARQATDDNTTQRECIAWWITKATDTVRICNAVLIAFPRQQLLRQRTTLLQSVPCLPT
jgi:hypothetical protein